MSHQHRQVRESDLEFLRDFVLVEEFAKDGSRLFPHTEQLGKIQKAVEREFYNGLPSHIAKTDHRGDGRRKDLLNLAAHRFCDCVNEFRTDHLLLMPVLRQDLVTRIAVMQHITQSTPKGVWNRFRHFAEGAFFPDIHLDEKKVVFATHVFDRFNERVAKQARVPLVFFLKYVFAAVGLGMRVNHRENAMVISFPTKSMLALPYEEKDDMIFFRSCLTCNEISSLEVCDPVNIHLFHHGPKLPDEIRLTLEFEYAQFALKKAWENKSPPVYSNPFVNLEPGRYPVWNRVAKFYMARAEADRKPDRRVAFMGNFHSVGSCRPGPDHDPNGYPCRKTPDKPAASATPEAPPAA